MVYGPNQPPKVGDFCLARPGNQILSFIVELGEKWFSYTLKFSARPIVHQHFLVPIGALAYFSIEN